MRNDLDIQRSPWYDVRVVSLQFAPLRLTRSIQRYVRDYLSTRLALSNAKAPFNRSTSSFPSLPMMANPVPTLRKPFPRPSICLASPTNFLGSPGTMSQCATWNQSSRVQVSDWSCLLMFGVQHMCCSSLLRPFLASPVSPMCSREFIPCLDTSIIL